MLVEIKETYSDLYFQRGFQLLQQGTFKHPVGREKIINAKKNIKLVCVSKEESGEAFEVYCSANPECRLSSPNGTSLGNTTVGKAKERFLSTALCLALLVDGKKEGHMWIRHDTSAAIISHWYVNKSHEALTLSFLAGACLWEFVPRDVPEGKWPPFRPDHLVVVLRSNLSSVRGKKILADRGFSGADKLLIGKDPKTGEARFTQVYSLSEKQVSTSHAPSIIKEPVKPSKVTLVRCLTHWTQLKPCYELVKSAAYNPYLTLDAFIARLQSSEIYVLLEKDTGSVVGFGRILSDAHQLATLHDLIVHPDYRKSNYGVYLTKIMERDAILSGCDLRFTSSNPVAQKLYETKANVQKGNLPRVLAWLGKDHTPGPHGEEETSAAPIIQSRL